MFRARLEGDRQIAIGDAARPLSFFQRMSEITLVRRLAILFALCAALAALGERAWTVRTGDVSTGSGANGTSGTHMGRGSARIENAPATVWSATPLFVNDTLYLGTPFYRIFALEPDSGKVKWTYDTKAVLKALTQPDLFFRSALHEQVEAGISG